MFRERASVLRSTYIAHHVNSVARRHLKTLEYSYLSLCLVCLRVSDDIVECRKWSDGKDRAETDIFKGEARPITGYEGPDEE
jgi:hypothetical protein